MNWMWMFFAALVIAAIIIVLFLIGSVAGYGIAYKRMDDDLTRLVENYKKALKENTDFFKEMADAINKLSR